MPLKVAIWYNLFRVFAQTTELKLLKNISILIKTLKNAEYIFGLLTSLGRNKSVIL